MTRVTASFIIAGVLLGLSAAPAAAQTLYGITRSNELITINTTTGTGTLVAFVTPPLSGPAVPIAFRGSTLYAWNNGPGRIEEVNPATGAILNTIDPGIPSAGASGNMSFRSDGIGYLIVINNDLYRFDITVPNSSLIDPFHSSDGLAFNTADVLYGLRSDASELHTVNQTNGITTLVGNTGIPAGFNRNGLSFDAAGNLFAVVFNIGAGPSFLYRVNSTTGSATLVGNIGFNAVDSIAFGPGSPAVGVTVSESGGATNVTEGGATDTYTVVLNTAPTANVTITINPGSEVTAVPPSLTFTGANWNVPQTVTVTAVDDALVEGPHTGSITHTATSTDTNYNGITIANVTANITDNDAGPPTPPLPPVPPNGGGNEGSFDGTGGQS